MKPRVGVASGEVTKLIQTAMICGTVLAILSGGTNISISKPHNAQPPTIINQVPNVPAPVMQPTQQQPLPLPPPPSFALPQR